MGYRIVYGNELYHYGVKGMRWGVRKSPEYSGNGRGGSYKKMSTAKKVAIGAAVVGGVGLAAYGGYKLSQHPEIFQSAANYAKGLGETKNKYGTFAFTKSRRNELEVARRKANLEARKVNDEYLRRQRTLGLDRPSLKGIKPKGANKPEVLRTTIQRTEIPRATIQRTEIPRATIQRTEIPRTNVDSYTKELLERNQRLLKKYGY